MILYTVVVVLLAGAGAVASLLQPPSTLAAKKIAQTEIRTSNRAPAGEGPATYIADAIDENGTQAIDFNMPCEGNTRFSRNVVQVRLSGKLCGKLAQQDIEQSEIRNMTNGFSATVFYPGPHAFTTDYITLVGGENQIHIQHILKSGTRYDRTLMIERE